jgi:hypothetical protein
VLFLCVFQKKLYQGRYESFSGLKDEFLLAGMHFLGQFLLSFDRQSVVIIYLFALNNAWCCAGKNYIMKEIVFDDG